MNAPLDPLVPPVVIVGAIVLLGGAFIILCILGIVKWIREERSARVPFDSSAPDLSERESE